MFEDNESWIDMESAQRIKEKMGLRCIECLAEINIDDKTYFRLYQADLDIDEIICSPSCLVAFAWRIKEQQSKLSKSKQEFAPIITLGPYGPFKAEF